MSPRSGEGVPRVELTLSLDPFLTLAARNVLFHAKDQGKVLGHSYVGTEHLLLGLLCERDGVAARVLEGLGVTLAGAKAEVERVVGRGRDVLGPTAYTPRAQRLMELALHEAVNMGGVSIDTEHVLLGMRRLGEGAAVRILQRLNVVVPDLGKAVMVAIEGPEGAVGVESPSAATVYEEETGDVRGLPAGEILVHEGAITKQQLAQALDQARRSDELIGRTLINLGLIQESDLVRALALQVGLEFVDLTRYRVDADVAKLLPAAVAWRHLALPIGERDGKLVIAMSNSANTQALEDIALITDREVVPVVATPSDIIRGIREHIGRPEEPS